MKSPELIIEHGNVATVHNKQVAYNVNSFYVLRIPCQFTLNELFNGAKNPNLWGANLQINRQLPSNQVIRHHYVLITNPLRASLW